MTKNRRWGVSAKLLLCFLAISAMSLASATIAWFTQRHTQTAVEKFTDRTLPLVLGAHDLAKRVASLTAQSQSFSSIQHDDQLNRIRQHIQAIQIDLDDRFTQLTRHSNPDHRINDIKINLDRIFQHFDWQLELI